MLKEIKEIEEVKELVQDLQKNHGQVYDYLAEVIELCQMAGLDETEYGIGAEEEDYWAPLRIHLVVNSIDYQWHPGYGLKRREFERCDKCIVALREGLEAFFRWQEQVLPRLLADIGQVLRDTKDKVSRRNRQIEALRETLKAKN